MTLDDLWGHTSFYEKFVFSLCWHSWKAFKRLDVQEIIYRRKRWFEVLRWPYVTFNDLWGHTSFYEKVSAS